MRGYTIFIYLLLLLNTQTYGQGLTIPYSHTIVNTDGAILPGEWNGAYQTSITVSTSDSVIVLCKHDFNAIYFAFIGKLESANSLFPEILFDPQLVKGNSWTTGQWWFHVSATDCENNGGYGVYTNCMATQPDWIGTPNFQPGAPFTDTVEMKIPFTKIGINPFLKDKIGIAFVVTNTASIWKLQPSTADKNKPSTWAEATIGKWASHTGIVSTSSIKIYPTVTNDVVYIEHATRSSIQVLNSVGQTIIESKLKNEKEAISLASYSKGVYILTIKDGDGNTTFRKIILE